MGANLDNYVEVKDRIAALYEKYPEASIQGSYEFVDVGDKKLIVYCSKVYRTAEDRRPATAFASEPFPGKTNFTRDSELMNAETSAIGRAIAALGFEVHRSVASREEVQARQSEAKPDNAKAEALFLAIEERRAAGMTFDDLALLLGSAGVDAPEKRSVKSVQERLSTLSDEQATALEKELGK